MIGITSYGAYIPWHRIDRQQFTKAWGGFAIPGERAVAYYDEDSVTMAVEAALDCIRDVAPSIVDSLLFATTTSPYKEKLCSFAPGYPDGGYIGLTPLRDNSFGICAGRC